MFAFCEDGDRIEGELAPETSLTIDGPFAEGLSTTDNLVIRAAGAIGVTARLWLSKQLPVASGIGGGSADAGATLRLLARLSGKAMPSPDMLVALGADVPACVRSETVRGEGMGDVMSAAPAMTGTPVLLVNPRVPVSTAMVFRNWDGIDRGPLGDWRSGRNDLEKPARAMAPAIGTAIAWLAACPGASIARMSGSGATCFAIFDTPARRDAAVAAGTSAFPGWWWKATTLR